MIVKVVWDDSGERAARERMRLQMEVTFDNNIDVDGNDNDDDGGGNEDGDKSLTMTSYSISGEEKPASPVGFGQMGKPNMMCLQILCISFLSKIYF